jgi:hypothetical protein
LVINYYGVLIYLPSPPLVKEREHTLELVSTMPFVLYDGSCNGAEVLRVAFMGYREDGAIFGTEVKFH